MSVKLNLVPNTYNELKRWLERKVDYVQETSVSDDDVNLVPAMTVRYTEDERHLIFSDTNDIDWNVSAKSYVLVNDQYVEFYDDHVRETTHQIIFDKNTNLFHAHCLFAHLVLTAQEMDLTINKPKLTNQMFELVDPKLIIDSDMKEAFYLFCQKYSY